MAARSSQGIEKDVGFAYAGDHVLVEVPVVDVHRDRVVIVDAVALDGLEVRPGRGREGHLHARLVRVICQVEALGDGVERIRQGDGLAVDARWRRGTCDRSYVTALTAVVPAATGTQVSARGIPGDGVRGHLQGRVRAGGLHRVGRAERLDDSP